MPRRQRRGARERSVEVHGLVWHDPVAKQWAMIEIRDSGGIESTDLHRIFIPFFSTKTTGHGVGLALAHRVITEHGGTLTAANVADGGAVFTIKLPQ